MATDPHDTATRDLHAAASAGPQMCMVDIDLIEESLTNPRKYFDADKLRELADSIKAGGVHQPVLLRPLPGHRVPDTWGKRSPKDPLPAYELVVGARRLRACCIAGLRHIPALIRDMTDEQALEAQVVENLQRADITPLEEADGYERLMQLGHADVGALAAKVGKSHSYVYARLKLLDLAPDGQQALREGKIDASRALRIARIPDPKLQTKALEQATRLNYNGDIAMGVRDFEVWLQQTVMLKLENAPFNITDASLAPGAGSCKDCPKRTGAEPDLFADVNSPDLCTDPACHARKAEAHSQRLRDQAEAKGMRVIDGKEAKDIISPYSSEIKGYTKLDTRFVDADAGGRKYSLRALLEGNTQHCVLIEHPRTKELIEAIPAAEAEALLMQRGLLKHSTGKIDVEARIKRLRVESEDKQQQATTKALAASMVSAARDLRDPAAATALTSVELLREWLKVALEHANTDDMRRVAGIEPLEDETLLAFRTRVMARIDAANNDDVHAGMLIWLLSFHEYDLGMKGSEAYTQAAGRVLGVDVEAVTAEAVAAEKDELKTAIANLRAAAKAAEKQEAPPAKGASTPRPAAQAKGTRAQGKANRGKTKDHEQAPAAPTDEAPPVPAGRAATAPRCRSSRSNHR